jgi:hypothetical protein
MTEIRSGMKRRHSSLPIQLTPSFQPADPTNTVIPACPALFGAGWNPESLKRRWIPDVCYAKSGMTGVAESDESSRF